MNALTAAGSILSILVGMAATLCWMGFIVAGMPNSPPAQEAALWRFFWAVAAGGLLCAAVAVGLLVFRHPAAAAAVGAVPVVGLVGFFVWAMS